MVHKDKIILIIRSDIPFPEKLCLWFAQQNVEKFLLFLVHFSCPKMSPTVTQRGRKKLACFNNEVFREMSEQRSSQNLSRILCLSLSFLDLETREAVPLDTELQRWFLKRSFCGKDNKRLVASLGINKLFRTYECLRGWELAKLLCS